MGCNNFRFLNKHRNLNNFPGKFSRDTESFMLTMLTMLAMLTMSSSARQLVPAFVTDKNPSAILGDGFLLIFPIFPMLWRHLTCYQITSNPNFPDRFSEGRGQRNANSDKQEGHCVQKKKDVALDIRYRSAGSGQERETGKLASFRIWRRAKKLRNEQRTTKHLRYEGLIQERCTTWHDVTTSDKILNDKTNVKTKLCRFFWRVKKLATY